MIYISHRGNLNGCCGFENDPLQVSYVICKGFDVEVDVWVIDGCIYLGHDKPTYPIEKDFLVFYKKYLWCHAKNLDALTYMLLINARCFWHENDKYTLVSTGEIWSFVGQKQNHRTICVLPENWNCSTSYIKMSYGICSDYIEKYKRTLC
jgi:hypothetical protein